MFTINSIIKLKILILIILLLYITKTKKKKKKHISYRPRIFKKITFVMPSYNWGHEQIFCFRGSVYQFWLSSSMIVSIPFREKGWSKNNIRIAPITNDSISGCKLMLIPFIIIVCSSHGWTLGRLPHWGWIPKTQEQWSSLPWKSWMIPSYLPSYLELVQIHCIRLRLHQHVHQNYRLPTTYFSWI